MFLSNFPRYSISLFDFSLVLAMQCPLANWATFDSEKKGRVNLLNLFGIGNWAFPRAPDTSQFLVGGAVVGKGKSTGWKQGGF